MRPSLRLASVTVAAGLVVLVSVLVGVGTPAARGDSQALVLSASLAPSLPSYPSIFGVPPGGAPWVINAGQVRLGAGGALEVNVSGLVIPSLGSNPVPYIAASVYCGGTLAATTTQVPYSSSGDAQIHASVTLPAFCPAPAVLLQPATSPSNILAVYIGYDGTA